MKTVLTLVSHPANIKNNQIRSRIAVETGMKTQKTFQRPGLKKKIRRASGIRSTAQRLTGLRKV
jgi:hypothetical protein